jgi:ATPase subunit of ABC transporter with duplicated ATPase domains
MGGWTAESDAQTMLSNVGIKDDMHWQMMSELENKDKVKVLLAQAFSEIRMYLFLTNLPTTLILIQFLG